MDQQHHHRTISATRSDGVVASDGVGQGKLYSPDHAIKVAKKDDENVDQGKLYSPDHAIKISKKPEGEEEEGRNNMLGMKNLAAVKDKVLEKLAATPVPSEKLENAKQYLEGVVRDVAGAAQGMPKDALHRIKTHLADLLPSVSPAVTGKMVDDAEKEANNGEEEEEEGSERKSKESSGDELAGKSPYVSPTSSFFSSLSKPFSRL